MGLDYGSKRVGVALSDPSGTIAQPHAVITAGTDEEVLARIASIVDEFQVDEMIVGLPLKLSGSEGESARRVLQFVEALKSRFPDKKVRTWDERMTTQLAEREMIRDNVRRRKRREVIDKIAAAIILQSYLDFAWKNED